MDLGIPNPKWKLFVHNRTITERFVPFQILVTANKTFIQCLRIFKGRNKISEKLKHENFPNYGMLDCMQWIPTKYRT